MDSEAEIRTTDRVADGREERALRGEALFGDDFSSDEIRDWFDHEREGFYSLYGAARAARLAARGATLRPEYEYSQLAKQHGYRWMPSGPVHHLLGVGSADGAELLPLLRHTSRVTVLEPSSGFAADSIAGTPVTYVAPSASGRMPFGDDTFDVVICFSALHHIPNVTTVVSEMYRVCAPGGYVLLREPTHSMGDWRRPRPGLTPRERGLPLEIFRRIIRMAGFQIVRETRCMFALTSRLHRVLPNSPWNYHSVVAIDRALCRLPIWPDVYHATRWWQKLRPTAVAYVLTKPSRH